MEAGARANLATVPFGLVITLVVETLWERRQRPGSGELPSFSLTSRPASNWGHFTSSPVHGLHSSMFSASVAVHLAFPHPSSTRHRVSTQQAPDKLVNLGFLMQHREPFPVRLLLQKTKNVLFMPSLQLSLRFLFLQDENKF